MALHSQKHGLGYRTEDNALWSMSAASQSHAGGNVDTSGAGDELLLDLWDNIWFGIGSPDTNCSSTSVRSRRKSAITADPLDNVLPDVSLGAVPLLPQQSPLVISAALSQGAPQQLLLHQQHQQYQQLAAAPASSKGSRQQQQQQLLPAGDSPRAASNSRASAAAIPWAVPAPSGPTAAASGRVALAAASDETPSSLDKLMQPQPQRQQINGQEDLHQQQHEQQPGPPAPFVLGTWAQRQYIMPLNRPTAANGSLEAAAASAAGSGEQPSQQQQQSRSSPSRPIPSGRWPSSSNGSSHSSNNSSNRSRKASAAHAASSSAGPSSGEAASRAPVAGSKQCLMDADDADSHSSQAAAAAAAGAGGAEANGDNAAAAALWGNTAATEAAAGATAGSNGRRSMGTDDEDEVQQMAWRWRFARRWQAEQTRDPMDHAAPGSIGDGGMEEALQYLAACGETWNHLSRGQSTDLPGTVDSRMLGTLGTPNLLGQELMVDDGSFSAAGSGLAGTTGLLSTADSGGMLADTCFSREVSVTGHSTAMAAAAAGCAGDGSGLQQQLQQQQQRRQRQHRTAAPLGEATVQVQGITKKAQQLLLAQSNITKAAAERWREVQAVGTSDMWVGAVLESVEIDDFGNFKFLLMRLRHRSGRTKLVVRGKNYASEAKIVEGLHRQMMAACTTHNLSAEAIEVVGGGVMEWSRHRNHHLHISDGYVSASSGPGGPSTPAEVMNLTAVLTKQGLPMHYKVTSASGKAC